MILDYSSQYGKKIITTGNPQQHINFDKIIYIQYDYDTSIIFLSDGNKIKEKKTLKEYEKDLCDFGFFRIHKNTIINGMYITEVNTNIKEKTVKLDEITLNIAKRRLKFFKNWLQNIPFNVKKYPFNVKN